MGLDHILYVTKKPFRVLFVWKKTTLIRPFLSIQCIALFRLGIKKTFKPLATLHHPLSSEYAQESNLEHKGKKQEKVSIANIWANCVRVRSQGQLAMAMTKDGDRLDKKEQKRVNSSMPTASLLTPPPPWPTDYMDALLYHLRRLEITTPVWD